MMSENHSENHNQERRSTRSGWIQWAQDVVLLMGREIVEGWRLWAMSLVVGSLPFLAPWLPSLSKFRAVEVREAMLWSVGNFFGVVFLVVLGSGFLARDLAEGRLGFYFSRPFGSLSLAIGRLLGAWVVGLGCLLLLFVGWWFQLISDGRLRRPRSLEPAEPLTLWGESFLPSLTQMELPAAFSWPVAALVGALSVLVVLLLVHGVTLWLRARSMWLLLDGLGLVVCGVLGVGIVRRLERIQALAPLVWLERLAGIVLLLALLTALWVQVRAGRNHLVRAHGYFSLTFWSVLLCGCLAADVYSRYALTAQADDLTELNFVATSPKTPWIALGGRTQYRSGTLAGFLMNYETGASWSLGGLDIAANWMAFSADGSQAAWLQCERLTLPMGCEVWSKSLIDEPSTPPQPTGIVYDVYPYFLALSPGGERVAVLRGRTLDVYDLTTRRRIIRQEIAVNPERMAFIDASRIRTSGFLPTSDPYDEDSQMIFELNIDNSSSKKTGDLPDYIRAWRGLRNSAVDVLFAYSLFPPSVGLFDGSTGEALLQRQEDSPRASRFLADGRLVLVMHDTDTQHMKLQVVSSRGEILLAWERDDVKAISLGSEWVPGQVWLALEENRPSTMNASIETIGVQPLKGWQLYSLQVDDGELQSFGEGIRPIRWSNRYLSQYEDAVGSPSTRLFKAGAGATIWWDPESGDGRVVHQLRR